MEITEERKAEIRKTIDDILLPFAGHLERFSFEDIREKLDISGGIFYFKDLPKWVKGVVQTCMGKYFMAFPSGTDIDPSVVAHELGHVVLNHYLTRQRKRIEIPEFGDSPEENAEANYFRDYWNERLKGVNWLRNTRVLNLEEETKEFYSIIEREGSSD